MELLMSFILYNDRGIKKYYKLPEDCMAIFGREEHCDFQILRDSMLSREHFGIELEEEEGQFALVELGASNGTKLNGKKLESNSITILEEGDIIKAGRQVFTFLNEVKQQESADKLMNDVVKDLDKGKGYRTIMCEILGMDKEKMEKK